MLKERSAMHKVNKEAYALTIKALVDHPHSAHELVEVSGLHIKVLQDLMRIFARHKLVHVGAWEPDANGRDVTPVWKWGEGRNAKRRRKTAAQVAKDYRERKKLRLMVNLTPGAPAGKTE